MSFFSCSWWSTRAATPEKMSKRSPTYVTTGDLVSAGEHVYRAICGGSIWIDDSGDVHGTALFERLDNLFGGDEL